MKKAGLFFAFLVFSTFAHAADTKTEDVKVRTIASETSDEEYLKGRVAFYKDALRKTSPVYICETPEMLTSISYNIWGLKPYKVVPVGSQQDLTKKTVTVCFLWSNN